MDSLPLPSLDLDELLKNENVMLLPELLDDPLSFPLLDNDCTDSPKGVLYSGGHPIISFPGDLVPSSGCDSGDVEYSPHLQEAAVTAPPPPPTAAASKPRKKRQPSNVDPKERIRAKNRRAQSRYREKQKAKRENTEQDLEQVVTDLERMRLENATLKSRNKIMENVLVFRDHASSLLETSKATSQLTSTNALPPKTKLTLDRLLPSAPGSERIVASFTEACPAIHHKFVTSAINNQKTAKNNTISSSKQHENEDHVCPLTNLSLSEVMAIKSAGHEVVEARYKSLAYRLRDALSQIEDARASEHTVSTARESMMSALWDCGCLCFEHAVLKPTSMQKLLAASVGEEEEDDAVSEKWRGITKSLGLTAEQRERLQPLRDVFLSRTERIAETRGKLLKDVQKYAVSAAGAPDNDDDALNNGGAIAIDSGASLRQLQGATNNWLSLHAASQDLEINLQEEHIACMEFVAKAFGGVLTPLQKAKSIVASYPAFPDMCAIATAALSEKNDEVVVAAAAGGGGGYSVNEKLTTKMLIASA